jgi:tRNA dimethylallyltransferase
MKKSTPTKTLLKPKILVILGPTATGKSDLAVKMAKRFRGEVISADSRQVYKGLDIGTGKITQAEMQGVHHWLIDVVSPKKTFTVTEWNKIADDKIAAILKRRKLPIICGGTGFYIQSIVEELSLPEVPPNETLRKKLEGKSAVEFSAMLKKLDPERLKNIDTKNPVRLIRAIEIATALGKVPKIRRQDSPYDILQIGLLPDSATLKKRIHARLLARIKKGMIAEAQKLHDRGLSYARMRELGLEYRYVADFLEKKLTKEELIEKLDTEIRRYAKRQMTWFKRDKSIRWFKPDETRKIVGEIRRFLATFDAKRAA